MGPNEIKEKIKDDEIDSLKHELTKLVDNTRLIIEAWRENLGERARAEIIELWRANRTKFSWTLDGLESTVGINIDLMEDMGP